MPVKTLPFRLYVQILIFLALVGLGALILWPLQQALYGGMVSIRDNMILRLEKQLGRKIRYSSISPSFLGSFDVRNISIMGIDDHPVLTMSRFRIAYSLMDLLRGRTRAIRSIQIDSPIIDFNIDRDNDLIAMFESLKSGQGGSLGDFSEMLPEKLLVRIRNGKFVIMDSVGKMDVDSFYFYSEISDRIIAFDGRWDIGISIRRPMMAPITMNMMMRTNGSSNADMGDGEAIISLASISGDVTSDIPVDFSLLLKDKALSLSKNPNEMPFAFSVKYHFDDKNMGAQFACDNFTPGSIYAFSGGLASASQLLDIAATGTASFERKKNGSLAYALDLSGTSKPDEAGPEENNFASFEVLAAGDEAAANISSFRVSLPGVAYNKSIFFGNINFSGIVQLNPFSPEGVISLEDFSISGNETINGDIAVLTNRGEVSLFCDTLSLGALELTAFSALLRQSENSLGFMISSLYFSDIESYDSVRLGTIILDGAYKSATQNVEAKLVLDTFPAGTIIDMALPFVKLQPPSFAVKKLADEALITTEIFINAEGKNIGYNAPRFVFASGSGNGFMGLIAISGTGRNFEVTDGRLIWKEDALYMTGKADFAEEGKFAFNIDAEYRNLGYHIEGAVTDGKSVAVSGSYGLNVSLSAAPGRGYSGSIRTYNFPLPFLGKPALLTIAAGMRYDSPDAWSMELERLVVRDIVSPVGLAQLHISGTANQSGGSFPSLYYSDDVGPLGGNADFHWDNKFSNITGTISAGDGRESYRLEGMFQDENLNISLAGAMMRLDRVLGRGSHTSASGEFRFSWNPKDSYNADLNFTSLSIKVREQELKVSGRVLADNDELSVNGLKLNYAGIESHFSYIAFDTSAGKADMNAEMRGYVINRRTEGNVSVSAAFKPVKSWLKIADALDEFSGKVLVRGFRYGSDAQMQNFDVAFSRSGGNIAVSGGPREMLRFKMDRDGNFFGGLSSPFPIRGTVIGSIKNRIIDAHCGDLYVDLVPVSGFLPPDFSIFPTGGYVNAAIDIKGSVTDPEFFGTARGNSVRLRVPNYIPQEMRPIPFTAVIDGNEIRFGPVSASVGNGAGTVSGWFRFDQWVPNIFSIDIAVPRETPVPFNFSILSFTARGQASGMMNMSMENLVFGLSGDLYANNTEMSMGADESAHSANATGREKRPVVANLSVQTGPVVEFLYPNSRFPILRANPDMGTRVAINVDTRAKQYSINSDVRIRSGEIFYFERSFYIRNGLLSFRENEMRFDPRLTARAELRDRNEDGPVTVSMIVDNAPLRSFTARFESNPMLSQMEILGLLGQSLMGSGSQSQPEENASAVQRAFLSSTTDLLAQLIVVRQLEQQIRNFMGLDMFSVRTQALQNTIFMATGLMQQPVDRIGTVGNYFNNTTVFGGKYIGQDMFIQGMLSMRYDENKTTLGGLTFEPDIGLELQGPVMFSNYNFLIRWDFVPTHPENWFVNDNSITLTWSRSF